MIMLERHLFLLICHTVFSIHKTEVNILVIKANSYDTLVLESDFAPIFILAEPSRSVQGGYRQLRLTDEKPRSLLME